MVLIIKALISRINAGKSYLNTELKNLLIKNKKNATAVKASIKILDINYDKIFGARAAWNLLIRLFSISILETIS
jgi:hypothetical protein